MRLSVFLFGMFVFGMNVPAFAAGSACDANDLSLLPENATLVACKKTVFNDDQTAPQGKPAIAATFNPKVAGVLTQKPTDVFSEGVPVYLRELQKDYGVRDVKKWAEYVRPGDPEPGAGISMISSFASVVNMTPGNEQLLNYVQTEMTHNNLKSSHPELDPSTGSCRIWSAWSMDPEVQAMFQSIQEGIFCKGKVFTRGQLAELMNAVYPDPAKNLKTAELNKNGTYDPLNESDPSHATFPDIEDANLALSVLGEFGVPPQDHTKDDARCRNSEKKGVTDDTLKDGCGRTYSENPAMFIEMAAAAKSKNSTLMMDLDGGTRDTWNQPIERILDISYIDSACTQSNADPYLTSRSLQGTDPDGVAAIAQIKIAEAQLKDNALRGKHSIPLTIQKMYQALNIPVPDTADLMTQVKVLKTYQVNLLRDGLPIGPDHKVVVITAAEKKVVRHKLVIKYGNEADNPAQRFEIDPITHLSSNSKTRVLDYLSVNGQASWFPPSRKLSKVCADRNIGNRVVKNEVDDKNSQGVVTRSGNPYGFVDHGDPAHLDYTCNQLALHKVKDRDFVVGAFPPKNLQTYTPYLCEKGDSLDKCKDQRFDPKDPKLPAYNFLKDMILHCDDHGASYHQASKYVHDLHKKISTNSLSVNDVNHFASEYKRLHVVLDDPEEFKDSTDKFLAGVGGDPAQITNLSALYQRLSQ